MKYLIDTHVFLWYSQGSENLSENAKKIIDDPRNKIIVSIATLWEISIKVSLNKLEITNSFDSILDDIINYNFELININFQHLIIQNKLPFYHKDPFDRILVAQAISEKIDFISIDSIMDSYLKTTAAKRIW